MVDVWLGSEYASEASVFIFYIHLAHELILLRN